MTTLLASLCACTGISTRDVARIFGKSHHTVKAWSSGVNPAPMHILTAMTEIAAVRESAIADAASGTSPAGVATDAVGAAISDHIMTRYGVPAPGSMMASLRGAIVARRGAGITNGGVNRRKSRNIKSRRMK